MKIYHLTQSGKLWIFNQKEVSSRKLGEALFQRQSKPGDVLKIDIPGQDTIKIVKLININKPMGEKKSQVNELKKGIEKSEEEIKKERETNAREFYKRYTALCEETGFFINAVLECREDGIHPKISIALMLKPENGLPNRPDGPGTTEPEPQPVK